MTLARIGVIGLGMMGSGMARALLAAGFDVTAYNRTAAKAAPLAAAGARIVKFPAETADADIVLLSLADEAAVTQVVFEDLATRLRPGLTIVDTSTVSPAFAREITERLAGLGVRRVEACVIGNPKMAETGELRVFSAGERAWADDVSSVLSALGKDVRHLGGPGSAGVLKLAFNLLLGVQTAGLAEAVTFAESMGMERDLLLDAFDNSGWRSPVLAFRAEFMRRRAYRPAAFRTTLMHKDLLLATTEAERRGVELPLTSRTAERFEELLDAGRGDEDAASVVDLPRAAVRP